MLARLINIVFVTFYLSGIFILPMGNFNILVDIPEMYKHCKAVEDKDMTPIDFITDHLICLDSLIDSHSNGDEQKAHQPLPKTLGSVQQPIFFNIILSFDKPLIEDTKLIFGYIEQNHPQSFFKSIFHPPVV